MIYRDWMKYIKDETPLTSLIIPSAHNAGTYGMAKIACCQDHDVYTQFCYGIRHFCVRLDTKKNEIVLCHGPFTGNTFIHALEGFKKIIDETETEFIIIDLKEYYPQKLGPFTFRYKADPKEVSRLVKEYLHPEKYAFCEFDDIRKVTMGDVRRSGKKFLLVNWDKEYDYSADCPTALPWDKKIFGMKAADFAEHCLKFMDAETDGFLWFQTQQTPNLGTDEGMRYPKTMDTELRGCFERIIQGIAENERYLEKANIISGDFMTEDYMKSRSILALNILKNNVIPELEGEYARGLWR